MLTAAASTRPIGGRTCFDRGGSGDTSDDDLSADVWPTAASKDVVVAATKRCRVLSYRSGILPCVKSWVLFAHGTAVVHIEDKRP